MGVEHGEPLQAKRQDQQQENPGQQPELTELAKAREALIVFVAGTERTSARSKAFSNLVSQQEMPLLFPRWQLHGETASQQNDRLIFDIWPAEHKRERRVQTNTALVKGYSLERKRILGRLTDYYGAWMKGPGRGMGFIEEQRAFPRELQAIRTEVFARQQRSRQAPPQE